jgi:hypothetical protein
MRKSADKKENGPMFICYTGPCYFNFDDLKLEV